MQKAVYVCFWVCDIKQFLIIKNFSKLHLACLTMSIMLIVKHLHLIKNQKTNVVKLVRINVNTFLC